MWSGSTVNDARSGPEAAYIRDLVSAWPSPAANTPDEDVSHWLKHGKTETKPKTCGEGQLGKA